MGYNLEVRSEQQRATDRRLARIEGQVRGLRRLLAEDAYCCDVLTQLSAVRSALDQVAASVASQHIRSCVLGEGPHPSASKMSREDLLDELDDVLSRMVR